MKALHFLPKRVIFTIALVIVPSFLVWQLRSETNKITAPPDQMLRPDISSGSIIPIPDKFPNLDANKVALGNLLFHEVSLSHDNTIACASCHKLAHGGTDGEKFSIGINGSLSGINAPTVFNCAFNFRQFWNGRVKTLEEQVSGPIHNPVEMGSNWKEVIGKLKEDSGYVQAFSKNYNNGITSDNIANAIATFMRSLITPNSRFDKYLKGDADAITPYEIAGYALFTDYGCIACHQGMNIGGNMFEKLGIMRDYFEERGNITEHDLGRFSLTKNPEDMHVFKVPSLRNIALTAPYLHDGTANSLEKVVIIMGKYQLGITLPDEDVSKIVAFLRTLTGEYNGKPL